jgi:uncharacterized membrane protein
VSQPEGNRLFTEACIALDIPGDQCGYVPTLVIGTTALVGSDDIPQQMPALVRDGLAAGGVDMPAVPGLREAYEASVGGEQTGDTQNNTSESAPVSTTYREITWRDRLNQDRLGNGLAIGVLGILIIGLAVQLGYGAQLLIKDEKQHSTTARTGRLFVLGVAMITMVIAATLTLKHSRLSLPAVLAAAIMFGMALIVRALGRSDRSGDSFPGWLVPVVACLGLMVAGYLAYVEIGENEAVCGAVGDCNTVQQSEYAELFGLIPIGLLGAFGYVTILVAWFVSRHTTGWISDAAQAVILGAAVFGTAFSIYLTFLEPFVIGATCAWCLTSALLMFLILCLQAPVGWAAVYRLVDRLTRRSTRSSQPGW